MNRIFALSGIKFTPEISADLWPKIMNHKWLLSERVGRDVGDRVACIDYLENSLKYPNQFETAKERQVLSELGALTAGRELWDTISDSQPPKQLIQRRIILPLIQERLSRKHGVRSPKSIIFFGPPGTGKTHFARAIAGILSWWYIEIVPSMLMIDGLERVGVKMRHIMERARGINEAVIFIDEFEEIASSRDHSDRLDKSITNEFLKQVQLMKKQKNKILLVCATNYIRHLDAALLRPGRFDCIIPVGPLERDGIVTIIRHHLSRLNAGEVDLNEIADCLNGYTPADIEYLFQQVAQFAFEQELSMLKDYKVTTETLLSIIACMRPSLTGDVIAEFEKDQIDYSRC